MEIAMFGLKKMRQEITKLKCENSRLNDKIDRCIGYLDKEKSDRKKALELLEEKLSTLDINLDLERAERKLDREMRSKLDENFQEIKKSISHLCEVGTENCYDIDQLKKSLLKPKRKVGRPKKSESEKKKITKKKDGQEG